MSSSVTSLLCILSAPAGCGKTSVVERLIEVRPDIVRSISYTTRAPRGVEKDGVDYHFISREKFQEMIEDGAFLEYAKVYDDFYGTGRLDVQKILDSGKHCILVIDVQGAQKLFEKVKCFSVFLEPPSFEVLKERLRKRGTDSEETIEKRIAWAREEITVKDKYDYSIISENVESSVLKLLAIIDAEERKGLGYERK